MAIPFIRGRHERSTSGAEAFRAPRTHRKLFAGGQRPKAVAALRVAFIATLEREVGAQLFARSTRAVALTEAGADYLVRIEPALAEIEEAGQALRGKGALRICVSASAAIREVIPRLSVFMAKNSARRVDLAMDDGRQDLIPEGTRWTWQTPSPCPCPVTKA